MFIKIAFDFGITNTDIAIEKNNKMEFHSFPSEKVETSFILKILNDLKVDINQVTKIAVTGGKSSDLEDAIDSIPLVKINEVQAIGYGARDLYEIKDSKKCSPKIRKILREHIQDNAIAFNVQFIHEKEIDELNILQATMKGMHKCIDEITKQISIDRILVDGTYFNTYLD